MYVQLQRELIYGRMGITDASEIFNLFTSNQPDPSVGDASFNEFSIPPTVPM